VLDGDPFLTVYMMVISTTCATLQLSPLKELLVEFKLCPALYDGELLRVSVNSQSPRLGLPSNQTYNMCAGLS
jgi:hypothetical protein